LDSPRDVEDFADCRMTLEAYTKHLLEKKAIEDASNTPSVHR
jgi:hypothetical protein